MHYQESKLTTKSLWCINGYFHLKKGDFALWYYQYSHLSNFSRCCNTFFLGSTWSAVPDAPMLVYVGMRWWEGQRPRRGRWPMIPHRAIFSSFRSLSVWRPNLLTNEPGQMKVWETYFGRSDLGSYQAGFRAGEAKFWIWEAWLGVWKAYIGVWQASFWIWGLLWDLRGLIWRLRGPI